MKNNPSATKAPPQHKVRPTGAFNKGGKQKKGNKYSSFPLMYYVVDMLALQARYIATSCQFDIFFVSLKIRYDINSYVTLSRFAKGKTYRVRRTYRVRSTYRKFRKEFISIQKIFYLKYLLSKPSKALPCLASSLPILVCRGKHSVSSVYCITWLCLAFLL